MTPPRSPSDGEAGFTIVELLIAVVITGLISAVLAAVLFQGLALGGMTRDRTRYAANATLFTDKLADDVANAATGSNPTASWTCTRAFAANTLAPYDPTLAAARGLGTVATFTPPASARVQYIAILTQYTTTSNKFVIERRVGSDVFNPTDKRTVLVGYCVDGTATVFTASYADPVYTLTLNLRPMPTAEIRTFKLNALRRDLVPPSAPPP